MQCNIFYARGIARPDTREVSSLSVEEHDGGEIVVSLFEVEASPASVAAFIEREHEFRWGQCWWIRRYAWAHSAGCVV